MGQNNFSTKTVDSRGSLVDDKLKPDSTISILVGGPYTAGNQLQRYGHTAVRVTTKAYDLTYDFGRYGAVTGTFGEEGEGILRVWSNFEKYIKGENSLGRTTREYIYYVWKHQTAKTKDYFAGLIQAGKPRSELERNRAWLKVYQLSRNYHALGYNCTTLSLDGIVKAIPNYENGSAEFIKPGDVLNWAERAALKTVGGGTPSRLFLPANLQSFLDTKPAIRANEKTTHSK